MRTKPRSLDECKEIERERRNSASLKRYRETERLHREIMDAKKDIAKQVSKVIKDTKKTNKSKQV